MIRYLPLAIVMSLAVLLALGLGKDSTVVPSPLIDKPAPEFALQSLLEPETIIKKQSLLGQPYLLNVWATWCANCRVEHPLLMRIADQGVIEIVGLNYKDQRAAATTWLREYGNPYQSVAVDDAGLVGIDFGVYGAPETFLIDAEGIIRHKVIGPVSENIWVETLLPIINSLPDNL